MFLFLQTQKPKYQQHFLYVVLQLKITSKLNNYLTEILEAKIAHFGVFASSDQVNSATFQIEHWKIYIKDTVSSNGELAVSTPIALDPSDVPQMFTVTNSGELVITGNLII